jgi:hypothetical protein
MDGAQYTGSYKRQNHEFLLNIYTIFVHGKQYALGEGRDGSEARVVDGSAVVEIQVPQLPADGQGAQVIN